MPVSAVDMYKLVMDIEEYPVFVPWVSGAEILTLDEKELSAELTIELAGMHYKFQTVDRFEQDKFVEIELLSGPFRFLESRWEFNKVTDTSCEVQFSIEFEFQSTMLDMVASPLFGAACKTMVKTFEKRALSLQG